jgi:hypothetical protein
MTEKDTDLYTVINKFDNGNITLRKNEGTKGVCGEVA